MRVLAALGLASAAFAPFVACGGNVIVDGDNAGGGGQGGQGGQGGSLNTTTGTSPTGGCTLTSTGSNGGATIQTTECFNWPGDSNCPPAGEAPSYVQLDGPCDYVISVDCGPVVVNGQCCYVLTETIDDSGCGVGRPFMVNGRALTARVVAGARDWLSDTPVPNVNKLSAEDRAVLADAWSADGLFEHASVAAFSRLSLALMSAGAPSTLVEAAHQAALDEIGHARMCFALASAYRGAEVGPSSLPLPDSLLITGDLVALAASAAREGCIGETVSAALAADQLAQSADPAVIDALSIIAEEEAQHAELSWRIVAWALRAGGEPVRAAVARVFDEAAKHLPVPTSEVAVNKAIRAHGRLDPAAHRGSAERVLREVVLPSARALLAPARESLAAFAAA